MSNTIIIATDGSSQHNGKPHCVAGWSMCCILGGKTFIRYGNLIAPSSNNRGEMTGVLYALKMLNTLRQPIKFLSDSQYTVKTLTVWKGSRLRAGGMSGVKNADLIKEMYTLWGSRAAPTSIEWVRGHDGHEMNELADEWCSLGRLKEIKNKDDEKENIIFVPYERMLEQVFGRKNERA